MIKISVYEKSDGSDMFKKPVYVTKVLKVFSKFWHHVKIGLEQGFYV